MLLILIVIIIPRLPLPPFPSFCSSSSLPPAPAPSPSPALLLLFRFFLSLLHLLLLLAPSSPPRPSHGTAPLRAQNARLPRPHAIHVYRKEALRVPGGSQGWLKSSVGSRA
eukprot:8755341-Pyramimonas_sp.AAC.1